VRIGPPRAYYWDTLDGDVAKIMDATLDQLRGAGAVLIDVDFDDLIKAALASRAPLRREDFRTDLAAFLASEYPTVTMKDVIPSIASRRVRFLEQDAWDNPPSRDEVEKARSLMDTLSTRYPDGFPQYNIAAIAYPTMPFPAPPADRRRRATLDLRGQWAELSGHCNLAQCASWPSVPRAGTEHSSWAHARRPAGRIRDRRAARR
jgi:Asp-tRNA(Asn)/Glu-tRNA(Gln) amidotransferase A subunit family amidase